MIPPSAGVVVAGSGAAGLTAALAAAVAGADVLLVERGERLGGTTALSGGRVWVPGNHLQDTDSREAAAAYLDGLFSDRYRPMTEAFLDAAPEMALFVERHSAHRFAACPRYPDYHSSRPGATTGGRALDAQTIDTRQLTPLAADILVPPGYLPMSFGEWESWRYPDRFDWDLLHQRERDGIRTAGVALVAGLLDGVVKAGARVLTGVRLTGFQPGSACLEHARQVTTIGASAVILATGGFDRDRPLWARLKPRAQRASGAPPTNTGDGLRIAERAGAGSDNLGEGWWMPMIAIPGETLLGEPFYRSLVRERGLPRQIMVNGSGQRFADEAQPYNEIGKALHRQSGPIYLIFDEGYRQRYPMPGVARDRPRRPGSPTATRWLRWRGGSASSPKPWRARSAGGTTPAPKGPTGTSAGARVPTSGSAATQTSPTPARTLASARSTGRPTTRSRSWPGPSGPRAARSPTPTALCWPGTAPPSPACTRSATPLRSGRRTGIPVPGPRSL